MTDDAAEEAGLQESTACNRDFEGAAAAVDSHLGLRTHASLLTTYFDLDVVHVLVVLQLIAGAGTVLLDMMLLASRLAVVSLRTYLVAREQRAKGTAPPRGLGRKLVREEINTLN